MRYFLSIILFLNITIIYGQNIERIAFHNNGESGLDLFPEKIEGSVETYKNSDTIKLEINDWIHEINKKYKVVTEDFYSGIHKIDFKCIIPVGEQIITIPYAAFTRSFSKVSFICSIEIKNNLINYTFENFYTNRRIVNGTGKSAGESNTLHWYRLNSITNIKNNYIKEHNPKRKKVKENIAVYDKIIKLEENIYIAEFESVKNLEKDFIEYFNKLQ